MIRQLCPQCSKLVELADTAAGTTAPCPACGQPFPVAASYTPAVDPTAGPTPPKETPPVPDPTPPPAARPLPPPGLAPAALSPTPPPVPPPTGPSVYGREIGFTLSPTVVGWLPVACLTLALILTLFAWVGTYPGGVRVYSQNPWQGLVGKFTANTLPDELLKDEGELEQQTRTSWWLWLYFPALFAAVAIGWVDRAFDNPDPATVPGPLAWAVGVWPHRLPLIAGLAALTLLVLLIQSWRGFGLENAVQSVVAARSADEAAADTTPKRNKVAVQKGEAINKFGVQGTTAFDLAVAAHLFAVLGAVGRVWLDRRGTKPPPRIVVEY